MSTSPSARRRFVEHGGQQGRWTPRAVAVLATAKELAFPGNRIKGEHILLALEPGEHHVSRVLHGLGISPSTALRRPAPAAWSPKTNVYLEDFDESLQNLTELVCKEAEALGDRWLGIEHLLLALSRVGVPGIDLPHERIKQEWLKTMGRG